MNGNNALDSLKNKSFPVFYPDNNGREGLFIWLIAGAFAIFGPSVLAMKLVSSAIGILTVLGLYLMAKQLYKRGGIKDGRLEAISLLASFFLATSFWHTNFSRMGFRIVMVPFISVFFLYFLIRAFQERRVWQFVVSGVIFGLGFYTYTGFRFAVLILPFAFGPQLFIYLKENQLKKFIRHALIFFAAVFIILLPFLSYFIQHPGDFIGRASQVSVFNQASPLKSFFISLASHLAMFGIYGDQNWRHNYPEMAMLPMPLAILFLAGALFSGQQIIVLSRWLIKDWLRKRPSPDSNNLQYALFAFLLLLSWFFAMLMPGILTAEGIPHSLRALGAVPVACLLAAIGAFKAFEFFSNHCSSKKLLYLTCGMILFLIPLTQFNEYFYKWGLAQETQDSFAANFVEVGNYLNSLPDNVNKYVIVNQDGVLVNGLPTPAQTVIFIERTKYAEPRAIYLKPDEIQKIDATRSAVIVPLQKDAALLDKIYLSLPKGEIVNESNLSVYRIY